MSKSKKAPAASMAWFEIAADDPERARKFYSALFAWKIKPLSGMKDYWHIVTGGAEGSPEGGLMARCHPKQTITNYINVPSAARFMAKVWQLGGKVCSPKMAVPGRGYFVMCQDPENNTFAVWEWNKNAK